MLTGFKARQDIQKAKEAQAQKTSNTGNTNNQELSSGAELELLKEAIDGAINENTHRVYIEDYPYLVEFKLPSGLELSNLQKALQAQQIKFLSKNFIGVEILVHTFSLSPSETKFDVSYKPLPRMRY